MTAPEGTTLAMASQTFQGTRNRAADAAGRLSGRLSGPLPGPLLRDLIDYAGLFPPASLAMSAAVANYDGYSRSEWNWILGRFIVPVSRLGEFEAVLAGLPTPSDEIGFTNRRLSV